MGIKEKGEKPFGNNTWILAPLRQKKERKKRAKFDNDRKGHDLYHGRILDGQVLRWHERFRKGGFAAQVAIFKNKMALIMSIWEPARLCPALRLGQPMGVV